MDALADRKLIKTHDCPYHVLPQLLVLVSQYPNPAKTGIQGILQGCNILKLQSYQTYCVYHTLPKQTAAKCNICIGMMNIFSKKVINLILFKLSNLKAIEGLHNLSLSTLPCIKVATSKFLVTSISTISSILNLFLIANSSCPKKINQEPKL